MGIYGAAHTSLDGPAYLSDEHPCMANQFKKRYGENVKAEDISWLALDIEPLRTDKLTVNGKEYSAPYFGEQDLSSFGNPKTGDNLPYSNYPMLININEVFVIDYTDKDGKIERMYFRSDGKEWKEEFATEQFVLE